MTKSPSDIHTAHFLYIYTPHTWHPYIALARLDRPVGYMLLWLPCVWGIALGMHVAPHVWVWDGVWYAGVLYIGAITMRGAGCAWNDIQDRHFDAQVSRTKDRPLPSGKITVKQAYLFTAFLSLVGAIVLMSLPLYAIMGAILACIPAILYPFFKRITQYPQIWLGLTFNWGIWVGWFCIVPMSHSIQSPWVYIPLALHGVGILWTLAYDTVYAHQDYQDDIHAGVKSTAIAFGNATKHVAIACYTGMILCVWAMGIYIHLAPTGYMILGATVLYMVFLIYRLNIHAPPSCKWFFKKNSVLGGMIALVFLGPIFTH